MRTVNPTWNDGVINSGGCRLLIFFCLQLLLLTIPQQVDAYPAILEIVLNRDAKGSFFVEATDDGDFLLKDDDFDSLGLPRPESDPQTVEGVTYYSLAKHEGLDFVLNEQTLALEIEVKPDVLPLTRIDFTNRRPGRIFKPEENSIFLNYGIAASGNKDDTLQVVDLTHELALRNGKTLFLTDGIYTDSQNDSQYIRLLSRAIRDDRQKLHRLTVGDHTVLSGPLGSQVLIGGAGYARNFDIDPYYINYPAVQLGGAAATPSVAEIYIDGMLLKKEELPPGPFMLENITRYEGAGDVEIVIRDAFNQEQRIRHPFYLAENILLRGTHEYSYNAGMLRELFGIESNEYGDAVFSGFHRYGWRDWLTLGVATEISPDFFSLVPRASMRWKHLGTIDIAVGASSGSGSNGIAAALEYFYRDRRFSSGFKIRYFSEDYARLDDVLRSDRPEMEAQLRLGYSTATFGSLNLGYTSTTFHVGVDRDETSLTYNRRLGRSLSMYTTVNQVSETEDETILLVGFNYSPWRQHQIGARIEERERSRSLSVDLQKNPPLGAGYGYRAGIDVTETDASDSYSLNGAGQYNGTHGILRSELELASIDSEFIPSYLASISGAITAIGGRTFITRPIRDSFALVKVGDLEGVRVVRNSEVIGTTDEQGTLVIPELTSYYDNQVAVMDEDIPIEYGLQTSQLFIQPALRSGSCVLFNTNRIQPLIGRFHFDQSGSVVPYDFRPLTVNIGDTIIETQSGYDGEFYIDITEAGNGHGIATECADLKETAKGQREMTITIDYNYDGKSGTFTLEIPPSEELFIEMGDLTLNAPQHTPPSEK